MIRFSERGIVLSAQERVTGCAKGVFISEQQFLVSRVVGGVTEAAAAENRRIVNNGIPDERCFMTALTEAAKGRRAIFAFISVYGMACLDFSSRYGLCCMIPSGLAAGRTF